MGANGSCSGPQSAKEPKAITMEPGGSLRPRSAHGPVARIVMVNDVYTLENYPRLATAIKQMKATAARDQAVVITCLPGDFLSPCTLTNIDLGVGMLRVLNEVPVDYVCCGNHEFDLKHAQLQKRIHEYMGKWINSNVEYPALTGRDGKALPKYDVVQVGSRKLALAAFLLDDMNQFAPIDPPKMQPPTESIVQTWDLIKAEQGEIDVFLPMFHLNVKDDRGMCKVIANHEGMSKKTPVVLGAHDHEVMIDECGSSLIFKVGMDAKNIGVVDLYWTADGALRRDVHMVEARDFIPEPTVQAYVDKQTNMLKELLDVPICEIPDTGAKLSTARVRFEPEPMVSFMLSVVKKSMGVDIVMLQGGNVRGGTASYSPGSFRYGDLMKELAFETEMAIVELPGNVVEESIHGSRTTGEGSKPFFLHCDQQAVFDSAGEHLKEVNGAPYDPKKTYKVGTYQFLLDGMGDIQPLASYCGKNHLVPPLEATQPIKTYFMQTCMKAAWRELLGWDPSRRENEFEKHVNEVFDEIDTDKNGRLDPAELEKYIDNRATAVQAAPSKEHFVVSTKLVSFLVKALDTDGDGKLSRKEVQAVIH